jgi:hypothetical protein
MADKVWQVGDKLAFLSGGFSSYWAIHQITKITNSGRITCGPYQLNPDLTVRRKRERWSSVPYRGEPVTQKILDEERDRLDRAKALRVIEACKLRSLEVSVLVKIAAIIRKATNADGKD